MFYMVTAGFKNEDDDGNNKIVTQKFLCKKAMMANYVLFLYSNNYYRCSMHFMNGEISQKFCVISGVVHIRGPPPSPAQQDNNVFRENENTLKS